MGWWIALAIASALCALLLLLPVRLVVRWYKYNAGSALKIFIKIGFFKFKILPKDKDKPQKPKKAKKEKKPQPPEVKKSVGERIKGGIALYKLIADDVKEIVSYTAQNAFRFELINFNFNYGTGDAATTGVLFGVISGIVHGLVGLAANFARVDRSEIFINPDFNKTALETKGECIVKLQNVHIMVIVIKVIKLLLKIRKERD